MTITRPSNYHDLNSTQRMMIDDHIRAGVQPPAHLSVKHPNPPARQMTDGEYQALCASLPEG